MGSRFSERGKVHTSFITPEYISEVLRLHARFTEVAEWNEQRMVHAKHAGTVILIRENWALRKKIPPIPTGPANGNIENQWRLFRLGILRGLRVAETQDFGKY